MFQIVFFLAVFHPSAQMPVYPRVEINHCHSDGRFAFKQVILYSIVDRKKPGEYRRVEYWSVIKDGHYGTFWRGGRHCIWWHDGDGVRREAASETRIRETRTIGDPELRNREAYPQEQRVSPFSR